jgi:hypothetical protein
VLPLCNVCGDTNPENFYPYLLTKCKRDHYAYQKTYRGRQAGKRISKDKKYSLKKRYGLSVQQFENLLQAQEERCASCREPLMVPQVDHNHDTNQVRGLLCNGCNRALGFLNDDLDKISGLYDYLFAAEAMQIYVDSFVR